jgi:hypothetical protein
VFVKLFSPSALKLVIEKFGQTLCHALLARANRQTIHLLNYKILIIKFDLGNIHRLKKKCTHLSLSVRFKSVQTAVLLRGRVQDGRAAEIIRVRIYAHQGAPGESDQLKFVILLKLID